MVRHWHRKFGVLVNKRPTLVDPATFKLRYGLIWEELQEFVQAYENSVIVGVADALADLLYVVYGTAVSFGIDMQPIFQEVHRSNMTKGDPQVVKTPNGKILKGENWKPPRVGHLVGVQLER